MQNEQKDRGVVTPAILQDMLNKSVFPYIDGTVQMDEEVVAALALVADNFLYQTMELLCQIVRHHHHVDSGEFYDYAGQSSNLVPVEIRDIQLALQMLWNIRIPGYFLDSSNGIQTSRARQVRRLRGFERNHSVYHDHLQNLETIRIHENELIHNAGNPS
uniref:Transcription initiation factor TFIID subunit 12 n=1 Tax=Lygus hesperus TaxID=30085 RepID=A0A0A9Y6B5_LYGHE